VGEKGELSKNDRREQRKRKAVRTGLEGEGSEKPWKLWKHRSRTSEANSIALPKSLWQKTTTSKGWTRRKRNSNRPITDANRGCAKSGV